MFKNPTGSELDSDMITFADDSLVYHVWTCVCSQPVSRPCSPGPPAGRCTSCCGHVDVALWGKWHSSSVWGTRIRLLYQAAQFQHRPTSGDCWFHKEETHCTSRGNISVWLHHLSVDQHLDFLERLRGNVWLLVTKRRLEINLSKRWWGDVFVLKTNQRKRFYLNMWSIAFSTSKTHHPEHLNILSYCVLQAVDRNTDQRLQLWAY